MKKLAVLLIFSVLIILSLQQEVIAEIEGEEERKKAMDEAYKNLKRTPPIIEEKIEEEIVEEEVKIILSKLIKLLPTEEKIDEVPLRTIW